MSLKRNLKRKTKRLITTALVLLIILFAGLNSLYYFHRFDLTESKAYTISEVSKNVFNQAQENVYITYYVSDKLKTQTPFVQEIEDLLYEYSAYSSGKMHLSILDPVVEEISEQVESMGVLSQQIQVVEEDQMSLAVVYTGISIQYLDRMDVIPVVASIENLEYDLSSRIRQLIDNQSRQVGILLGDSTKSLDDFYKYVPLALSNEFDVIPLNPGELISRDLKALVILGGIDFSEEDLFPVDQYIMSGGKVFIAEDGVNVDPNSSSPPSVIESPLHDMMASWGLELQGQLVLDTYCKMVQYSSGRSVQISSYPHWVQLLGENASSENVITSQFSGLDLFWASPLVFNENQSSSTVNFEPLLSSSNQSWLMEDYFDISPQMASYSRQSATSNGPYIMAGALNGEFTSYFSDKPDYSEREGFIAQSGETRIVVVGDSDFPGTYIQSTNGDYNLTFLETAVQWLSFEDDLLQIKNRTERDLSLNTIQDPEQKKAQIAWAQFLNIYLIPLAVIIYGLVRSIRRKNKKSRKEETK